MTTRLGDVVSLELLRSCWEDVLAGDREDGVLGVGVARFVQDAPTHLEALSAQLTAGDYRPGFLARVEMLREDGTARLLHVPPVRDRVVERALLTLVTPLVDPLLGVSAFAYRPGLGVADAVQALARLRDEGLGWVVRADVHDCFPSIPIPHLCRLISAIVDDGPLLDLIEAFLARASTGPGGVRAVTGLGQGCALSPLWANLVLTRLDDRLADAGFPAVRYSDDVAVAAASSDEAWEAMRVASDAVGELGMQLGADKSEVMSFVLLTDPSEALLQVSGTMRRVTGSFAA